MRVILCGILLAMGLFAIGVGMFLVQVLLMPMGG